MHKIYVFGRVLIIIQGLIQINLFDRLGNLQGYYLRRISGSLPGHDTLIKRPKLLLQFSSNLSYLLSLQQFLY